VIQDPREAGSTGEEASRISHRSNDWWAAPAAATLVVVCCAGPLLLGALIASGAGGWLASHGFLMGGAVVMIVAAVLAVQAWMRVRRRVNDGSRTSSIETPFQRSSPSWPER